MRGARGLGRGIGRDENGWSRAPGVSTAAGPHAFRSCGRRHGRAAGFLHFDGAPPNDEAAARIRTASADVQRTFTGVLQELSSFLFGSPLPPDADYHLEAQGDRFRITFGSDEVRIVETMNKDRALEEMIVATQRSTVSVRPQFKRGEKGFLPVVIDSSVAAAGTDKVELHVEIAYQTHDGFELPQTVKVSDKPRSQAVRRYSSVFPIIRSHGSGESRQVATRGRVGWAASRQETLPGVVGAGLRPYKGKIRELVVRGRSRRGGGRSCERRVLIEDELPA